jgi:hypothetical protein
MGAKFAKRCSAEDDDEFKPAQTQSVKGRTKDDGEKYIVQSHDTRARKKAKKDISQSGKRLFKVGIDYGTAYVAVAYAIVEPNVDSKSITPADLKIIQDYPDDPKIYGTLALQVPNISWYSQVPLPLGREVLRHVRPEEDGGTPFPDSSVIYGFSVRQQLSFMGPLQPEEAPFRCIERAKLLLSEDKSTEEARKVLQKITERLKQDGLIEKASDIIEDQLESILRHTKQQLQIKEGFDDYTCDVEFVVTVPPTWKARADGTMVDLLSSAALKAGFANSSNIFLVSETEAAVNFLVESGTWDDQTVHMDTCTMLDCGGATCDITTLVVDGVLPRLKSDMLLEEDDE